MCRWSNQNNDDLKAFLKERLSQGDGPIKVGRIIAEFKEMHKLSFCVQIIEKYYRKIVNNLVREARNIHQLVTVLFFTDAKLTRDQWQWLRRYGQVKICSGSTKLFSFQLHGHPFPLVCRKSGFPNSMSDDFGTYGRKKKEMIAREAPSMIGMLPHLAIYGRPTMYSSARGLIPIAGSSTGLLAPYTRGAANYPPANHGISHVPISGYQKPVFSTRPIAEKILSSEVVPLLLESPVIELKTKERIAQEEDEDQTLTPEEKRELGLFRRRRLAAEEKERENAKKPFIPKATKTFYQLLEPLWTGLVSLVSGNQQLHNYLMEVGRSLMTKKTELETTIADDGASQVIINTLFAMACIKIYRVTDEAIDMTDYISPKLFFAQLINLRNERLGGDRRED